LVINRSTALGYATWVSEEFSANFCSTYLVYSSALRNSFPSEHSSLKLQHHLHITLFSLNMLSFKETT
jgi:hypothetical protein